MQRDNLPVVREEVERVDTLRYTWDKLQAQNKSITSHLLEIQPEYRNSLLENITLFIDDSKTYVQSYQTQGPMVEGIDPRDATNRLIVYQGEFDGLWRRYYLYLIQLL